MSKPFDLEAFKAGQKAVTRDGRIVTFVGICDECAEQNKLVVRMQGCSSTDNYNLDGAFYTDKAQSAYDLVSIVSRHQHLIDSYDPEDTWQIENCKNGWFTLTTGSEPEWNKSVNYRLHPHNDLIQAHRNGAKIQVMESGGYWSDADKPTWKEHLKYRIKPTTKTVYEWLLKAPKGNCWSIGELLMTEEEVDLYYDGYSKMKTGRSWEVEV